MLRAYIGLFLAAIALMAFGCTVPAAVLATVALTGAYHEEVKLMARKAAETHRKVRVAKVAGEHGPRP